MGATRIVGATKETGSSPKWVTRMLVAAPLSITLSALLWARVGREPSDFAAQIRYFVDNYNAFMLSNMARLVAFSLLIPFALALRTIGGRRAGLRRAAGVLLVVAAIGEAFNVGADITLATAARQMRIAGSLTAFIAAMKPQATTPFVMAPIFLGELAFGVGLVLAAISLWRYEGVSTLTPAAIVVGTLVMMVGGRSGIPTAFAVGSALVLIGTGTLAKELGRSRAGADRSLA